MTLFSRLRASCPTVAEWWITLLRCTFSISSKDCVRISTAFDDGVIYSDYALLSRLSQGEAIPWRQVMSDGAVIKSEDGRIDYLSTIFYLLHCVQEYDPNYDRDHYQRARYAGSVQAATGTIETNLVRDYITEILALAGARRSRQASKICITHDVDSLHGSLKYDGLWALRRGDVASMLQIIWQTVIRRPAWYNIDQVLQMESVYDIKACYYWIVNHGRDSFGIKNADYNWSSDKIQGLRKQVEAAGQQIGLHKSTLATSYAEEERRIGTVVHNRNHFLMLDPVKDWTAMETAGFKTDASLGYPDTMGYRSSCGLPYRPYSWVEGRMLDLLVVPLNIMDGMQPVTDERSGDQAYRSIVDFIERNREDSIISVLWHNSELTSYAYKHSLAVYKALLKYFYDSKMETISMDEILQLYMEV